MAQFQRLRIDSRQPRRWMVIAVEGQTELRYFEDIRMRHRLSDKLVRVRCQGSAPASVVQCALSESASAKSDVGNSSGQTWAVFDGEEHQVTIGQRRGWNDALQAATSHQVGLAISNPSFELWLLLHFRDQTAALHRDDARRQVASCMGQGYDKGQPIVQNLPAGGEPAAIARAEHLLKRETENQAGPFANPSTRAHQVVASIADVAKPS